MSSARGFDPRPTMIFHVPFRLDPSSKSASGIRPLKMRQAFEDAGYRVLEVSGDHEERRSRMRSIKRAIEAGLHPQFLYSEAKTVPTGLGEPVTRHTSLSRDVKFLQWCRERGIPTGLFYRDVYWQFPGFDSYAKEPWLSFLKWRYRADLKGYGKALTVLYVPSAEYADYLPNQQDLPEVLELPPGLDIVDDEGEAEGLPKSQPRLFYVGGLGSAYGMHAAVEAVNESANGSLVMCTRQAEWNGVKNTYEGVAEGSEAEPESRVRVVHASGAELDPLYSWAQVGSLFMEPDEYRNFMVPLKLYEYLGHGKPVVASEGTYAARVVEKNGLGWVVPYSVQGLTDWLDRLGNNPDQVEQVAQRVRIFRERHTWRHRAEQVAADLTSRSQMIGKEVSRDV